MSDQLVPADSPLRTIPESTDQRTILYLDGIRYSIEIAELTFNRLLGTLSEIETVGDQSTRLAGLQVMAFSDAWMLIDSIHRLRELVQQTPRMKQNDPNVQLFLRNTLIVEKLRNFIQHLRTGIPKFAERNMPLWGTLSWGREVEESVGTNNPILVNHTILPGAYYTGVWAAGLVVDTQNGRFAERLVLTAGEFKVDLEGLFSRVQVFAAWYKTWFEAKFKGEPRHASDIYMRITHNLVRKQLREST